MALPEDFAREALYDEGAWFIDELIEMSDDAREVMARLDTTKLGALVDAQRPWPGHAKHLPGAVIIQMTGTLGNLHAFYGLGLRCSEGWVGHGVVISKARFHKLGRIGPEVIAKMTVEKVRAFQGKFFVTYTFRFFQEEELLYQSSQMSAWSRFEGENSS